MNTGSQQSRLDTVSTLASTLADEILSERLVDGSFSAEKSDALEKASRLLEECSHPVPDIVADALAQCRRHDPIEDDTSLDEVPFGDGRPTKGGAKGAFMRLIRSVRPAASA